MLGIGNIGDYLKMTQLKNSWALKKQNITAKSPQEQMLKAFNDANADKDYSLDSITQKIEAGKKLSPAELDYIREKYPDLYRKAVKLAAEREAYEKALRNCKSKEEVQLLRTNKITEFVSQAQSGGGGDGPSLNSRVMSISEAHTAYTATSDYKTLPNTTAELLDKKKARKKPKNQDTVELEQKNARLKQELPKTNEPINKEGAKPGTVSPSTPEAALPEQAPSEHPASQQSPSSVTPQPIATRENTPAVSDNASTTEPAAQPAKPAPPQGHLSIHV